MLLHLFKSRILGLTWCIPCVTIATGGSSSPLSPGSTPPGAAAAVTSTTSSSSSSTGSSSQSGSTVIKTVTSSTSTNKKTVIRRSGSLSSNCSHAVQCSSGSRSGSLLSSENNAKVRPCIKHQSNGSSAAAASRPNLSQSYDDLLSATGSNSSANSNYGFVRRRPVLKRSSSLYRSTSGLPSSHQAAATLPGSFNKSVKFNLPTTSTANSTEAEEIKKTVYQWAPATNYFFCQSLCANCGMCPLTTSSHATAMRSTTTAADKYLTAASTLYNNPNFQYALIQAQNFFNYQVQQQQQPALTAQEETG